MKFRLQLATSLTLIFLTSSAFAGDTTSLVKKAIERSTLNQPGTSPFHLKATLSPTYPNRDPKHSGDVEIWWVSPTRWRREVRSPEFHQVSVVDDGKRWQKNDGELFPEWLREAAVELINPIPDIDRVLSHVKEAERRDIQSFTHFSWVTPSSDGHVEKTIGAGLSIDGRTGLIDFGTDTGWDGEFSDYRSFHGRMVAHTVKLGEENLTAKIEVLEDLPESSRELLNIAQNSDPVLDTVVLDELALRKNLLSATQPSWPPVQNAPFEGVLTATVLVDRTGKVREFGTILSDNGGVIDAARSFITSLQFKPYERDGVPVQVLSRLTMPFKTSRPAGMENFDSARGYFEKSRTVNFPAASANTAPYVLKATFQVGTPSGGVDEGQYVDTWKSPTEWRREATLGKNKYVRARKGDKLYQLREGNAGLLEFVFRVTEPIPALDTFHESDWRIKRDLVGDVNAIRVLTGYESPDGKLDPEQVRGFWFDDSGRLLKTYFQGLESQRSDFQIFGDAQVAHQIVVLRDGKPGLVIRVTDLSKQDAIPDNTFEVRGHDWTRAFTDQVR